MQNAFSSRLSRFGFNIYDVLAVDVLHEWEVGIWPSILRHLIRILATYKDHDRIHVMDERYVCFVLIFAP